LRERRVGDENGNSFRFWALVSGDLKKASVNAMLGFVARWNHREILLVIKFALTASAISPRNISGVQ